METIVFIILQIFFATRAVLKIVEYLTIRLRARVFYEQIVNEAQIENDNIANQIHRFLIDYGDLKNLY